MHTLPLCVTSHMGNLGTLDSSLGTLDHANDLFASAILVRRITQPTV